MNKPKFDPSAPFSEEKPKFDPSAPFESSVSEDYDWSNAPRDLLRTNIDALPMYGQAVGSLLGPIGSGLGQSAGNSLKEGINGLIDRPFSDNFRLPTEEQVAKVTNGAIENFNMGAVSEMGGQIVGKALPLAWQGAKSGANKVGEYLAPQAEKLAVNSTGATGAQSAKFADDAGRELLDRKLVRFGDNADNIAKRTGDAMDGSNAEIDSALKRLDVKGVTASADNVVMELETKIADLSKDASQTGQIKKLKSIVEDITATGESNIPISLGEKTKRGFNKMAGNWMDPEVGAAGKTAYQAYRSEVEKAAQAASPELAEKFTQAKKTYGLLAPIEEAATKRANTLNQSPFGGLLDVATVGGGGAALGGPLGLATGVTAAVGRKLLAPRVASSAAVTIDTISKSLMSSPQMAKLAKTNPAEFSAFASRLSQSIGQGSNQAVQQVPASMMRATEEQTNSAKNKAPVDKKEIMNKLNGSKYSQVLQNAADKGDDSFNAAHFILSSRDEGYRKQISGEGN